MTSAAIIAIVLGVLELCAAGLFLMARPAVEKGLRAFPRHQLAGRLLVVVDAVWCAGLIYVTPFESLSWLKPYLYGFTPVAIYLICVHLDDLLAPRALGGLLLLAGAPLLKLIQWHDSPWRLVIAVCLYAMVIKGMMLIMFPYMFRQAIEFWFVKPGRVKMISGIAFLLGALLLGIGFTVL